MSSDSLDIKALALGAVIGAGAAVALLHLSSSTAAPKSAPAATAPPSKLWKCPKAEVDAGTLEMLGQRKDTVSKGEGDCQVGHKAIVDASVDTKVGLWSCTPGKFAV